MRRDLPSGTVTFLFTDIEGSTRLLHELGPPAYAEALREHRQVLREAFTHHGGVEVDTEGDAFFVAFATAPDALAAAGEAQERLASGPIRVRMGLHTGRPHVTDEGYVGSDVHKGARIAAAGHGGQVLLSKDTRDLMSAPVTDLGEHRLKDFDAPVWIFQLGSDRFPPLKTISNTNLPRPASSFIGRKREVVEVASLLRDGARLLTLTGPGGSGKTRLAIESAADLVPEFKAGVFWVGLAPLRDPNLVTMTIAQTLGAKDGLAEHVGEREMLLLLDNVEQVVEAAPDLATLIEACPNLRLLCTSREVLRVKGEVEYPVSPLADPEAVELFAARSRLGADDTIHELCRRLDNLPLAIELAAARTKVLSPAQILERLSERLDLLKGRRDAEARQATLRATIEWSYDLLTPEEKGPFAKLSVFRGGCTVEAAEAVADADLDTLQSLVEKSLLRHRDERFWMLETIREYAAERLEESAEAEELRRRHAEHFLRLAEEAELHVRYDSPEWADRLARDHDNLRATLDRLEEAGDMGRAMHLAGTLSRFWYVKSHLAEGQRRLERALEADPRPTLARAKALTGLSVMALNLGDATTSRDRAQEALALYRALADSWGIAYSQMMIGNALSESRELAAAVPFFEESTSLFQEIGDEHYALISMSNLAWVIGELGEKDRERTLQEEILLRARAQRNERMEAGMLGTLGMTAHDDGRLEEAAAILRQAIRIDHRHGDTRSLAIDLGRIASVLVRAGDARVGARLLAKAEAMFEGLGATAPWWASDRDEKTRGLLRSQLDDSALSRETEEGRRLTVDEAVALALDSLDEPSGDPQLSS